MNESDHEKLRPGTTLTFRLERDADGSLPEIFATTRKDAGDVFLDIQIETLAKQKKLSVEGIKAHQGEVNTIELSGDRKLLVSSGKDATKMWSVDGGHLQHIPCPRGFGSCDTNTIATSNDAKAMAWGSRCESSVHVKAANGRIIHHSFEAEIYHEEFSLEAVAMSPDSKLLVATGWEMNTLLWKDPYKKSSKPKVLLERDTYSTRFSHDGKQLAVGRVGGVDLWKTEALDSSPRELEPKVATDIYMLAFSNDNQLLAAGNRDYILLLDTTKRGGKFNRLGEPSRIDGAKLQAIVFSPNDVLLASGGIEDSSVILWNVAERQRLYRIFTEQDGVIALTFLDDEHLLSAGKDGTFKIWNLRHIMEVSHLLD